MSSLERTVLDLFKIWVQGRLIWTGRETNANKMTRILPLFQGFVLAHADFFSEHYGYTHRGRAPGQLAPVYALFRDRILLQALTEIRNELMESMGQDTLPPLQYIMKRTARQNGVVTPRAVLGWETRN